MDDCLEPTSPGPARPSIQPDGLRRRRTSLAALALAFAGAAVIESAQAPANQPSGHAATTVDAAGGERLMDAVTILAAPEMEGRRTGTPGGAKARAWVAGALKATGLPPAATRYELPFQFTSRAGASQEGVNLAAMCRGTEPTLPVIVVSAHYDHLGIRDGSTYPGADDNASGVAALLEVARRCRQAPYRHTAIIVAFDAEEQGLQGARAFVASPPVPRGRIALDVNMDMVARGDKGELYAAGTHHYPALAPALREVAGRAPVKLLLGHDRPGTGDDDWTNQSDHGPFHDTRIPFVYFGVEDHPDYHKPTDTADRIDPAFFRRAVATILDAIVTLDRQLDSR